MPLDSELVPVPNEVLRVKGHGIIYDKRGVRVDETDYDVIITPSHLRHRVFEPGLGPKNTSQPEITGQLSVASFKAEVLRDVATLELEDGTCFDFRVLQPETKDIVGVSWLRRCSSAHH
jgi:hypothetical protein